MRPLLPATALLLAAVAAQADEFTLTILHVNDLHSRYEPISRFDGPCSAEDDAAGECFGGAARLATALARARADVEGDAVIYLNAGDVFQGSLFYTTYKGTAAAELLNAMPPDVMMLGNHEFDDGPEALGGFLDLARFPVIRGNVEAEASPPLAGKMPPWTVIEAAGRRIGVVGALAEDTVETSSPGPDVAFTDAAAHLREAVAAMQADGVDIVIALTHLGLPRDLALAQEVEGIDVVIGGHSHTLMSNDDPETPSYPQMAGDTPVAQAYAYGKYLGVLTVTFDADGEVVSASGDPMLIDSTVAPDPGMAAAVAALAGPIEDLMGEVVGEAVAPIEGDRAVCRVEVCAMGVLVAEAMLDRVRDQGVQVAIQNGGGLRASIDEGPITLGEVLTVLPFQNTLSTFQLTGAEIRAALENGVSQVEEGAGRFPQVAGLRYVWDREAEPGARIRSVEVRGDDGWASLDDDATYGVVSNNFMRKGGDGYAVFRDSGANAYDYGPNLEEVVAAYLADNAPYEPMTDDRIRTVAP
jgi:5'-nucleotidase